MTTNQAPIGQLGAPTRRAADGASISTGQATWSAVAAALASERPIAYNVNVSRVTGDVKAALFMSQLLYWTKHGVDVETHGGWIFKTREQWAAETGLTRYEQESARDHLASLGLIQEARIGVPARNCYRVVPQVLGHSLAALLRTQPVQWTLFDLRSEADNIRSLLGRNLAFYRAYTDITQSTTAAVFLTKALAIQQRVNAAQAVRMREGAKTPVQAELPWDQDWFYISPATMTEETGLSTSQQREAKQKLYQQNLLLEAVQTHPRRKVFMQVNLPQLSIRLRSLLMQKMTDKPKGLLGAILKTMGATAVNQLKKSHPGAQTSDAFRKLRTVTPCDSAQKPESTRPNIASFQNPATVPGWDSGPKPESSAQLASTFQKLPTVPPWDSGQKPESAARFANLPSVPDPRCQNQPSSFAVSANLVGGFSQVSRMDSAPQLAGKSTSSRLLSATLHVRVGLTTSQTTTTTTTTPRQSQLLKPAALMAEKRQVVVAGDLSSPVQPLAQKPSAPIQRSAVAAQPTASKGQFANLIWPSQLDSNAIQGCLALLNHHGGWGSHLTPERAQLIVDELDGKLSKNKVMQPISYFRRLLELDQQQPGGLVFEVAHDVARTRIARQAQQDRQHAMLNQTTLAPRGSPAPVQSSASDSAAKAAAIKQLAELRKQIVSKDRSPSPQSGQTASATGASVVGAQALPARARLAMGLRLSKTTI